MNLLIRSAFILLFGASATTLQAATLPSDDAQADPPREYLFEMPAGDPAGQTGSAVDISYLKDKDGKSYIVSIRSEDAQVNRMIRQMIGDEAAPGMIGDLLSEDSETLAITFIYNNIR